MKKKGYILSSEVIWWVIGILILAFGFILYMILSKQGFGFIDKIKEFLRFWR